MLAKHRSFAECCLCYQPSTESAVCTSDVGRACASDADCEYGDIDGVCKHVVAGRSYPDGICDFAYSDRADCELVDALTTELADSFYLNVCDGLYRACIPEHPIYLKLVGNMVLEQFMFPLCVSDSYQADGSIEF